MISVARCAECIITFKTGSMSLYRLLVGTLLMLPVLSAEVVNSAPGPLTEFGAAAIRASANDSIGRVAIAISAELEPEVSSCAGAIRISCGRPCAPVAK